MPCSCQGWNKISLECKECGEKAEHMEPVFLIDLDLAGSSLQARCSELVCFEHVWLSCLLESGVHRRIQQAGNGWWRQAQQSHEQWFVCVCVDTACLAFPFQPGRETSTRLSGRGFHVNPSIYWILHVNFWHWDRTLDFLCFPPFLFSSHGRKPWHFCGFQRHQWWGFHMIHVFFRWKLSWKWLSWILPSGNLT